MDRSHWHGRGAPTWIRRRYDWGPTKWPLHWCEAVGAKELCCGAQAALTLEAFRARGMDAIPAQLVQRYQAHDAPHWHSRWTKGGANPEWASEGLVYHEVCGVLDGDRLQVWNPTASAWMAPDGVEGYASVVAIRAGGAVTSGRSVLWGSRRLELGEWTSTAGVEAACR
jgi:hypothetical protein